ncbi:hypothetical protein CIHG_10442 [Coccidioides immitis H538.4]|uniref:Uncharacterized protein n=1 Tax=Coccidioides immitis H538.4 TaxID=396776 RepID=A0A0J8S6B4_COCIT|nr:hypothetical protein CIHG_10442 [Coccidioides immitis H538.4]
MPVSLACLNQALLRKVSESAMKPGSSFIQQIQPHPPAEPAVKAGIIDSTKCLQIQINHSNQYLLLNACLFSESTTIFLQQVISEALTLSSDFSFEVRSKFAPSYMACYERQNNWNNHA